MNWKDYPDFIPSESGVYLTSIERPYKNTTFTFNYIAYFDSISRKWKKYNPFIDDSISDEEIIDRIIAWSELATFLGTFGK
ncbi:MAG: hypothetical protein IPM34_05395 [Saprospiraceae bacterium]|nr:hypothetical protein [Saprospiraceae bacterium]